MAEGAQMGAEGAVFATRLAADFVRGEIGEVTGYSAVAELNTDPPTITVKVSAKTTYGNLGRQTTAGIELKEEDHPEVKQIAALLVNLIARAEPRLKRRLQRDAVMAMAGAVKLGEEIEEED